MMKSDQLIVVLGPTASGKTALAVQLAVHLDGEILSADSRQVYRQMDIGTGKDLAEYTVGNKTIAHHLIDIVDAGQVFHINDYFEAFRSSLKDVVSNKKTPIVCGGSGLYLEMAIEGNELAQIPVNQDFRSSLENEAREEIEEQFAKLPQRLKELMDSSTVKRMIRAIEIGHWLQSNPWPESRKLDMPVKFIGLNPPAELRCTRISRRLHQRLEEGMVEEVEQLMNQGISPDRLVYYGLEYKWITEHLIGKVSRDEMIKGLETAIHRFSKRQMTWFRRMERKGWDIRWLKADSVDEQVKEARSFIG